MNKKNSVLFIGEAMLELVNKDKHTIAKSFAGDTFNSGVYLKRAFPEINSHFMTAIGNDMLSREFVEKAQQEQLNTDAIAISDNNHLGAYMVVNDETGERTFIYWRNDSAARLMLSSLSEKQHEHLITGFGEKSVVFFSGIILAVLLPKERELFWRLLNQLQEQGATIVFDPNYRPALWENADIAKQQIEKAFSFSDWLMPGLDDFTSLYGFSDIKQCLTFCQQFSFEELVVKQGSNSVHVINQQGHQELDIVKSKNVVDTTSAGDAFNGVYLGARLQGKSPLIATKLANYAASKVIETPGAIMPKDLFLQAWSNKPLN